MTRIRLRRDFDSTSNRSEQGARPIHTLRSIAVGTWFFFEKFEGGSLEYMYAKTSETTFQLVIGLPGVNRQEEIGKGPPRRVWPVQGQMVTES